MLKFYTVTVKTQRAIAKQQFTTFPSRCSTSRVSCNYCGRCWSFFDRWLVAFRCTYETIVRARLTFVINVIIRWPCLYPFVLHILFTSEKGTTFVHRRKTIEIFLNKGKRRSNKINDGSIKNYPFQSVHCSRDETHGAINLVGVETFMSPGASSISVVQWYKK